MRIIVDVDIALAVDKAETEGGTALEVAAHGGTVLQKTAAGCSPVKEDEEYDRGEAVTEVGRHEPTVRRDRDVKGQRLQPREGLGGVKELVDADIVVEDDGDIADAVPLFEETQTEQD